MKTIALAALLTGVFLTACSSAYHPKTKLTGGYTDQQLAPDSYRVTYETPADSSAASHVKDLALLRAAELCRQTGCTYFKITQQSDESSVASAPSAGLRQPPAPFVMGSGSNAKTANVNPRPTVLVTQTTIVVRKLVIEIRTFKEKPVGLGVIEVEPLYARLSEQYR